LRVLVVSQYYWPEDFRITDLARGLCERGHEVEVLTGLPNYPAGRFMTGYGLRGPYSEEHEGVAIRRVPLVPRGAGGALRLAANYLSYATTASLRALSMRPRWDVSLVFQPSPVTSALPAVALRALRGVPSAVWVQDLWPESVLATGLVRSRALYAVARAVSGWLYRRFDAVLGTSEAFGPRLEVLGVTRRRYHWLPQWAEDIYTRPAPGAGAAPGWARGFPVVFAGNLGRVQALDTVLDAADLLREDPDVRWVFFGDGSMSKWLADESRRRGLMERVHLLGRRPAAEMPANFAHAGAMLVSLKTDEVLSLTVPAKVQSYLAAARPIVASLGGEGARIIEESGAGVAAPPGDARALAAAVRRIKDVPAAERAAMGRRGRAYYDRQFSRPVCLERLEQVLAGLAVSGRHR
jgi:glycosyltransferase involved in cell wall biosynthesis